MSIKNDGQELNSLPDEVMIKAFKESQERLLRVITGAPIVLFEMDLQGIITLSEGKGLAKLGLAPGEVVGQSMFERNAGRPDVLEILRRALKGEETTSTLELRGEIFETHYSPQLDATGTQIGVIAVSEIITERKKAEEALRDSEALYRSVITAMSEGVVLQDTEGVIQACNPSAERILGLAAGALKGKTSDDPCWQAIKEDGSPFAGSDHPAMLSLRTGSALSNVVMGIRKPDSQLVWLSVNAQPLFREHAEKPYAVVTSFTDISERIHSEEMLRESEERYRSIFENSPDGVLLTIPEDGSILSANAEACHIFEMSETELCSLGRGGVVDFSDPRLAVFLEERKRTGKARSELTLIRKDGTRFPAEVTSTIFTDRNGNSRTSMIISDITKRKIGEAALRASQEQYQSIFNATRDGIFITDSEGNLVDFNPEAYRMLGYTAEEFRQLQTTQIIHPDSMPAFAEYLSCIQDGRQFRGRAVGLRKDGSIFPVEVFGTPISYYSQPHALAVVRDITEQVQAYNMLEQRVSERTQELSALLNVSRNVASTLELRPLLALILNQLRTVVDYSGAAIITLEEEEFVIQDYIGPISRDQALQTRIPLKTPTVFREVATQLAPIIYTDLWGNAPINQEIRENLAGPLGEFFRCAHSWLGVPLVVRDCLMGVLSVDHVQPGFYTQQHARLVWAFADQAAVAIGNAGLYKQAQELAALEERQKLARELHDSVSQALYGIALGARTARTLLDRDPSRAVEPMDYCLSLAEAGLAEMRSLIFELRPESLEKEGLVAALTKQADALRARMEIQVGTRFCDEPEVPLETKQVFYRIAQEALQNIFKHAQASQVLLELDWTDRILHMSIQDNGRGFNVQGKYAGHMGLLSMRERIQKIGGTLNIRSAADQGTQIDVEVEELFETTRNSEGG